jgi:hypothetical protein
MSTLLVLERKSERSIPQQANSALKEMNSGADLKSWTSVKQTAFMVPKSATNNLPQLNLEMDTTRDWGSLDLMAQLDHIQDFVAGDTQEAAPTMTFQADSEWNDFCDDLPLEENA